MANTNLKLTIDPETLKKFTSSILKVESAFKDCMPGKNYLMDSQDSLALALPYMDKPPIQGEKEIGDINGIKILGGDMASAPSTSGLIMVNTVTGEKTLVGGVKDFALNLTKKKKPEPKTQVEPEKIPYLKNTVSGEVFTLGKGKLYSLASLKGKHVTSGDSLSVSIDVANPMVIKEAHIFITTDDCIGLWVPGQIVDPQEPVPSGTPWISTEHVKYLDNYIDKVFENKKPLPEGYTKADIKSKTITGCSFDGYVGTCCNCGSVAIPKDSLYTRLEVAKDLDKQCTIVHTLWAIVCDQCGEIVEEMSISSVYPDYDLAKIKKW